MLRETACAPRSRRYDRRGTHRDLLVLDDGQSAVHLLLLRLYRRCDGEHGRRREEAAAGGVDPFCLLGFLRCRSGRFFPAVLQMQGVVFAGVQAVHARHAAAVVDAMVLVVDAGGLAAARTEAAIPALLRVEHWTEQRETGEESQDRSHGTDRIAIGASVPPCQHGQHDQCQRGDNERRQALHPHLRFIKGVAVRPLGEASRLLPQRYSGAKRLEAMRP